MPENLKWEIISFLVKIAPLIIGVVFAWIAAKKPSVKKAFAELNAIIKEAASIVNQVYVEPRKKGGTWDEAAKIEAREMFWAKFLELAQRKADFWLNYLLDIFGADELKNAVVNDEMEAILKQVK